MCIHAKITGMLTVSFRIPEDEAWPFLCVCVCACGLFVFFLTEHRSYGHFA